MLIVYTIVSLFLVNNTSLPGKLISDEKPILGSKQGQELVPKDTSEEAPVTGCHSASNLDAAKVAAIKAAELGEFLKQKIVIFIS